MNFFNRILGRRYAAKKHARNLAVHRNQMNQAAEIVIQESGLDLSAATRRERSVLATFFFGILSAHGMQHKLTPPDLHALCLLVLIDTFKFDETFAALTADECIRAANPGHHDTMHAIIHRGIDAHERLIAGDQKTFRENLQSLLAHFKNVKDASG